MIALDFAGIDRLVNRVLARVMRLGHTTHIRIEVMLRCDVFEVDSISLIDYILCGIS